MKKTLIISLALNVILVLAFILSIRACNHKPSASLSVIHSDTVVRIRFVPRTDTVLRVVTSYVPSAVKIIVSTDTLYRLDSGRYEKVYVDRDTASYSDSLYATGEFKAVIAERVFNSKILDRTIQWANLAPVEQIEKTVTDLKVAKAPFLRLSLGGAVHVSPTRKSVDIAPGILLTVLDRFHIVYEYGVIDNQHSLGLFAVIRLKK
jgi:hypothetical protein